VTELAGCGLAEIVCEDLQTAQHSSHQGWLAYNSHHCHMVFALRSLCSATYTAVIQPRIIMFTPGSHTFGK